MIHAKKKRKTIEWERLKISSRNLEIPRTFHAEIGTIKDKNHKDPREAAEVNKRW